MVEGEPVAVSLSLLAPYPLYYPEETMALSWNTYLYLHAIPSIHLYYWIPLPINTPTH